MTTSTKRPSEANSTAAEAGLDWPVYDDGEAPWSEDEQFEERRKACKARTKKFGECGGEGDYEGQCDDCDYDAQDVLRKKYRPAPASSQPVVGVDQTHPSFNDAIEAAAKVAETFPEGRSWPRTEKSQNTSIASAIRSLKLPDYRKNDSTKTAESENSPSTLNAETE